MDGQFETVLDHMDDIRVPGDVFRKPANEYWALLCLRQGLEFLYAQASRIDAVVGKRVNAEKYRVVLNGNAPELTGVPTHLPTCAFHWYAVSACNYARLVKAIAYKQDTSRPKPLEYIKRIMPEVLAFRDKVAAHFAWSTKNEKDNDAERMASIFPQLGFHDDSFFVGGMQATVKRSGQVSDSGAIGPWSIVKMHERLRQRYWPQ